MPKQIWEQVYERILSDIGEKAPGEMVFSELQYAGMLAVSRATVRKAVDELVHRQLVVRVAGKGLKVRADRDMLKQGAVLISCACLPGDGDNFKSVLGCIEAAEALHMTYKTLNYTDPKERLAELTREDLAAFSGVVLTCYEPKEDDAALDMLLRSGLPVVVICNESETCPFIDFDAYNAGYLMGQYLVKHGHSRILYIGTDRPIPPAANIKRGFCQVFEECGLPIDPELFLEVEDPGVPVYTALSDQRELPKGIESYVRREIEFTAVTGHSAFPIFSFIKQMLALGISIPEDLSVVSMGDELYMPWLDIPLSGIALPKYEIGYQAVAKIHKLITGEIDRIESELIPVQLVQRNSVADLNASASLG